MLIVPSLKIWLDVENLANIAGLEDNITNIDMTLMFLSKGYFTSWNCLREVRHATFVHALSIGAADGSTAAAAKVVERRRAIGIQTGGPGIILVREAEEQVHGGAPLKQLLGECPEHVGCPDHVLNFNASCERCSDCALDIRAVLRAQAYGTAGVIDWVRFKDFKMISLKQIVQQMLVSALSSTAAPQLLIPGELTSLHFAKPTQPRINILLHAGCLLSGDLPTLLDSAVAGITTTPMPSNGNDIPEELRSAVNREDGEVRLLVVVHAGCFDSACVVASIRHALTQQIPITLVHEADADYSGCDFGTIMGQCPPDLKQIRGFNGLKLFDPIAVQWSRGAHQPVSVRLLAMSLGAITQQTPRAASTGEGVCRRGVQSAVRRLRAYAARRPGRLLGTDTTADDAHVQAAEPCVLADEGGSSEGWVHAAAVQDADGWAVFGEGEWVTSAVTSNPLHQVVNKQSASPAGSLQVADDSAAAGSNDERVI
jgi:hypothetical protein